MAAPAAPTPGATSAPVLQATPGPAVRPAPTSVPQVSAHHVPGLAQGCLCHSQNLGTASRRSDGGGAWPACGVTEVKGQVTGKKPTPGSQPPLSSPVPQRGNLCEQAWHPRLPLCHWLPGPTL